ncbi:hypothetical protein [Caudoviricetes sp.]|nr:hypothetical protein [Caudoviricetes sp.]
MDIHHIFYVPPLVADAEVILKRLLAIRHRVA